jgi:hypothetical protein
MITKNKHKDRTNKQIAKGAELRLFKLTHKFLKVSLNLQTVLEAEAHVAEGQKMEE